MAEDWERLIKKREVLCSHCERVFEVDEVIVTALFLDESGFERKELCLSCEGELDDEPFSTWRAKRSGDEAPPPRRLDLSYLSDLFRRLQGKEEAMAQRLCWISALLLLRKKLLELRGRREGEGGEEILLVGFRREEESYELPDPKLDDETIASISEDLGNIFNLEEKVKASNQPKKDAKAAEVAEPEPDGSRPS